MRSLRFFQFFQYLNGRTLRKTIAAAFRQRLPGLASEMAYNAMLSLFPATLAVLTAIGLFNPLTSTFEKLANQMSEVAPTEVLGLLKGFAQEVSQGQDGRLFSFSFLFALWAASGALGAAMTALDQIHQIPPRLSRPFWKSKLVALMLTLGAIVMLLFSLALMLVGDVLVSNTATVVASQNGSIASELLKFWGWLALPLILLIMSLAFGIIYRYGPSRWNPGQPIMPGAVLAAVIWAIVSNLFRLYVKHFGNYNRVYGAVGAVIVLLLWLYMSSLVLLLGDQLNVTVGEAMLGQSQERQRNEKMQGRR
ncbi:MAG: YihY/virulence factor BrkB family protein [Oscillatoriophycideae cyanobacterium NC_groundwater_1537_Pr4_S-0.65um_50_18]|nr:YihY/virulence factor BrkB family protein [Oscillatoriophycideae cyanobacterium NC_groundwater_1537_Pr4_S-0.65um_50_18]